MAFRLGHIGFQHVQWLIHTGHLKVKVNSKAVANCERPKCSSCAFGKSNHQPNKVNTIKKNHMKEQELKKDHILPGQMVYADHYIAWDPCRLYHTNGKSYPSDMFYGGFFLLTMPVFMLSLITKWLQTLMKPSRKTHL